MLRNYLSDLKWLFLSWKFLPKKIVNWREVMLYYLSPIRNEDLTIRLRNTMIVTVFRKYPFEAIAETILLDVYETKGNTGSTMVDVGASIGDSVLQSVFQTRWTRVYAFEPDPRAFAYLRKNIESNRTRLEKQGSQVFLFNTAATRGTLDSLFDQYRETSIDFLKIDCEGCEYSLLLPWSRDRLRKIRRISMEFHKVGGQSITALTDKLMSAGFQVKLTTPIGHGTYLYGLMLEK
jgi:precorrin-6B methylase 2